MPRTAMLQAVLLGPVAVAAAILLVSTKVVGLQRTNSARLEPSPMQQRPTL